MNSNDIIMTVGDPDVDRYIVNIYCDTDAESPREWDNLWSVCVIDNRSGIKADDEVNTDYLEYFDRRDFHENISREHHVVPFNTDKKGLYLYEDEPVDLENHDGYFYLEKKKAMDEFGPDIRKVKLLEILDGERKVYNAWVEGEVYILETCVRCEKCGKHSAEEVVGGTYWLNYAEEEARNILMQYQSEEESDA